MVKWNSFFLILRVTLKFINVKKISPGEGTGGFHRKGPIGGLTYWIPLKANIRLDPLDSSIVPHNKPFFVWATGNSQTFGFTSISPSSCCFGSDGGSWTGFLWVGAGGSVPWKNKTHDSNWVLVMHIFPFKKIYLTWAIHAMDD